MLAVSARCSAQKWDSSSKLVTQLHSCKKISEIKQIHGLLVKTGLDHDPFTISKLLASSIQDIPYAASIFNRIQIPKNLFMFNTMLRAYSISDDPKRTFDVFDNLRGHGFKLDQFSFITTLKACTRQMAIDSGQMIHGLVMRSGFLFFVNLRNALLHFYSGSGSGRVGDARKLFDEIPQRNDLVSWNTLMGGYIRVREPGECIELFRQMCRCGVRMSVTTFLCCLSAYGDLGDLVGGGKIHGHCFKVNLCSNLNVATSLIEMYAKTGNVDAGRRIFDGVVEKDVVLWNCMIDKYAKAGQLEESVALLELMIVEGGKANSSSLAGLLSACAASGLIKLGRFINRFVEEEGLVLDAILGTALVDMFAKCGFLNKAVEIFERMQKKDMKSWTAMILGYGLHGQARNAVALFHRMEEEGFRPNEVTFLAVLSACSHGGLVAEGKKCFEKMVQEYDSSPKVEHYGCMIDLLGRAGLLEEAHDLINSLPIRGDTTAWRTLLAACRVYGNVEVGERVKRMLVDADEHPADSILLSSAYAIAGRLPDHMRWQTEVNSDAENRSAGTNARIPKEVACSTVEMDGHCL